MNCFVLLEACRGNRARNQGAPRHAGWVGSLRPISSFQALLEFFHHIQ